MTVRRTVVLATPLVALVVLLAADFVLRANLTPAQASTYSLFFDVAFSAFAVSSTIAGTLIVVRQRRNVVGWLLLAAPGATRCTTSCSARSGSVSRRPARWPS